MKTLKLCLSLAVCLAFTSQAIAKDRLAVAEFRTIGNVPKDCGKTVVGPIIAELSKNKQFDLIERALTEQVLKEQGLQLSAIIDERSAARLGKVLGAQYVLIGQISKVGYQLQVEARIVNTETAKLQQGMAGVVLTDSMADFTARRAIDLLTQMGLSKKGTTHIAKERIAVLDFEEKGGVQKDTGSMVAEMIVSGLSTEHYTIIERSKVHKLLKEMRFQTSSIVNKGQCSSQDRPPPWRQVRYRRTIGSLATASS